MKYTCCPVCETVFRVSAEQLEARQGKVRCGQCAQVFNAFDNLAESPELLDQPIGNEESLPTVTDAGDDPIPAVLVSNRRPHISEPTPQVELDLAPTAKQAEVPAQPEEDPWALPEDLQRREPSLPFQEELLPAEPRPLTPIDQEWTPEPEVAREEEQEPAPPSNRAALLWGAGTFALALVALLQVAWVFRSDLSMAVPALRPVYVDLCHRFGCEMPLPKKSDLIGIEGSELKPASQGKGLLQLSATLRNRAGFAQTWPHLEVTLTDTDDKPLARRVFAPKDILPPKTELATGFAAGADQAINLILDPTSLTASGYRIYVFYP